MYSADETEGRGSGWRWVRGCGVLRATGEVWLHGIGGVSRYGDGVYAGGAPWCALAADSSEYISAVDISVEDISCAAGVCGQQCPSSSIAASSLTPSCRVLVFCCDFVSNAAIACLANRLSYLHPYP